MKKYILFILSLFPVFLTAQKDFSAKWEDFYSYNNVKDFIQVDNVIYAVVDNAVFTYDLTTKETKKLSSIKGFSGETASTIHYNNSKERLIIGYENGLIEVIDKDGEITISAGIINFNQSGEKTINHISEHNDKLYISTPFAIVVYDIKKLEFGDTYFIGDNSTSLKINKTIVFDNKIYAVTERGIFVAEITNPNLIDSDNWSTISTGNYTNIVQFNSSIYCSKGNRLFQIDGNNITLEKTLSSSIIDLKSPTQFLLITLKKSAIVLDFSLTEIAQNTSTKIYNYTLNTAFLIGNTLFLGTKEYGLLESTFDSPKEFSEIHPKGPLSNSPFSLTAKNNNLWVVYGGYNAAYTPLNLKKGFSHYNGETWINTHFNPDFPVLDMVHVTIDPMNDNRVFISSFAQTGGSPANPISGGGLLEVVNDKIVMVYHSKNSPIEDFLMDNSNRITTRISSTVFDSQGNLWIANSLTRNNLEKMTPNGEWSNIDFSVGTDLNEIIADKNDNIWMGSRGKGLYVYSEKGNRKRQFITTPTEGNLPHANVRAVAVDRNNKIWIGTQLGITVYDNTNGIFDASIYKANPIIIKDDGIDKKLLGDQIINTIAIDGADNKWFGTDNGGVVYTNSDGQKTLELFNKDNSPLPSNRILKISIDIFTGKVFFATDKGIVAYKSNIVPFGKALGKIYAYPNPALKNHQTVTIDGRNGTHIPRGTNVKIIDVSGNLVYETNVVEGQEVGGGKVIWDKTNLAGRKVSSGIYIVLLSNDDTSETAITKIAIVN